MRCNIDTVRLLPQQSDWPDCECRPVPELACKSAQLRSLYNERGVVFSLQIPDLLSASYWSLDVRLSYSDLNISSFLVNTSGDHSQSYDGNDDIVRLLTDHLSQVNLPSAPVSNSYQPRTVSCG